MPENGSDRTPDAAAPPRLDRHAKLPPKAAAEEQAPPPPPAPPTPQFEEPSRRRIFTWWRGCGVIVVVSLVVAVAGGWWVWREFLSPSQYTVINQSSRTIAVSGEPVDLCYSGAGVPHQIPPGGAAEMKGSWLCRGVLVETGFGRPRFSCTARAADREGFIRVTDEGITNVRCETR